MQVFKLRFKDDIEPEISLSKDDPRVLKYAQWIVDTARYTLERAIDLAFNSIKSTLNMRVCLENGGHLVFTKSKFNEFIEDNLIGQFKDQHDQYNMLHKTDPDNEEQVLLYWEPKESKLQ